MVKKYRSVQEIPLHPDSSQTSRIYPDRGKGGSSSGPEIQVTKFGLNRFINGFLDLLSVTLLPGSLKPTTYSVRWEHCYSLSDSVPPRLVGEKLIAVAHNLRAPLVTNNPYFYIALTCMVIGSQLFSRLFGRISFFSASDRNVYRIEKNINHKIDSKLKCHLV